MDITQQLVDILSGILRDQLVQTLIDVLRNVVP